MTPEHIAPVPHLTRRAYLTVLGLTQPLVVLAYVAGPWRGGLADYYARTYALAHLALVAAVLLVREGVAARRWALVIFGSVAALGWVAAWAGLELAPLAGQVQALPAECRRVLSL